MHKKIEISNTKAGIYKGITTQEFDFLRSFIDIESPYFGNAYQSALKAGYSKNYARVIRRHYSLFRMKMLKNALKTDGLERIIEATRHIDFGPPVLNEKKMKRTLKKQEKELYGMTSEEVINELDILLGKRI